MTDTVLSDAHVKPNRKVGVWLGIGIFCMPYVFAWFLLRKGHTKEARIIAFVWLAIFIGVDGAAVATRLMRTPAEVATENAKNDAEAAATAQRRADEEELKNAREQAFNALALEVKDPGSMKLAGIHAFRPDAKSFVFCGLINAKNSFGAYTGYQDLVISPPRAVFVGANATAMHGFCAGKDWRCEHPLSARRRHWLCSKNRTFGSNTEGPKDARTP